MDVYVFGLGNGKKYLDYCLQKETNICGYIDNYKADKIRFFEGKPVIRQNELEKDYDYIIITLMHYEDVRQSLISMGIEKEKLISFFDFRDASDKKNWKVIDANKWRMELMWLHYTNVVVPFIDNISYELYSDSEIIKKNCPKIVDVESTVDILKREKKCLSRFGDGEFEIMCGRPRPDFQKIDSELARRLKEVLNSHEDNLMIAIANNYGSLDKFTDEAARDIRMYLTKEVRKNHMELLDLNRQYYDAYLSRPYILYRDKESAGDRFNQIKEIWTDKDILIVEGEYTRFGVGNNLLENAKDVKRIIVPAKNAFDKYSEIKNKVCYYGKDKLILSIIGPTATVLAYDLAKENYWIIDIGQLDTEYEWYLQGVDRRCELKYRGEVNYCNEKDMWDRDDNIKLYYSEIIEKV